MSLQVNYSENLPATCYIQAQQESLSVNPLSAILSLLTWNLLIVISDGKHILIYPRNEFV